MRRNIDKRRTTFGNKCRRKFGAGAVGQIERAALRVQHTCGAFDNQAVQISRPDRFAKCFPETVQEIEDQGLFDLHFLVRTFESANASSLSQQRVNPNAQTCDEQPEKNSWPHEIVASLLPRGRLMKVLL